MRDRKAIYLIVGLVLCCAIHTHAGDHPLRVARIFSNNMVLQRDIPVRVWGWAHPGEQISINFKAEEKTVRANWYGQWQAELSPLAADCEPGSMIVKTGTESLTFTNVLVGEVWLASGQSNMYFPVKSAARAGEEIAAANYPNLRLFTVGLASSMLPLEDIKPGKMVSWQSCTSDSVSEFSAVAYYFARDLHNKLKVPIGIIHSSWGGTPIENWIPVDLLQKEPLVTDILQEKLDQGINFSTRKADYDKQHIAFMKERAVARAEGRPVLQKPPLEIADPQGRRWPGGLWNAMIHPLAGYTLRGMIWYQGEGNAGRAYAYRTLFPLMIDTWREYWGQGDLPFYWVQLASAHLPLKEPAATGWAELRQAQTETLALNNTAQALAIDLTELKPKDLHPLNKQDVGYRLALLARKNIYGEKDLVAEGPEYKSHEVVNGKIIIRFEAHDDEGLVVKGDSLTGFAIAGSDKKWVWADAELNRDGTVSVWSDQVTAPIAVRYGFENNPPVSLYNKSALPAPPFRTDDWGWITAP